MTAPRRDSAPDGARHQLQRQGSLHICPEWDGKVGFVPNVLGEAAPSAENAIALVCGPPIMIKFTLPALEKLGFSDDAICTTLENRMR